MLMTNVIVAIMGIAIGFGLARLVRWSAMVLALAIVFAELAILLLSMAFDAGFAAGLTSCITAGLSIGAGWFVLVFFVNLRDQASTEDK